MVMHAPRLHDDPVVDAGPGVPAQPGTGQVWVLVPRGRHASVCQQVLEHAGHRVLHGGPSGLLVAAPDHAGLVADLRAQYAFWATRAADAVAVLQSGDGREAVLDQWSHAQLCAEHALDLADALHAVGAAGADLGGVA